MEHAFFRATSSDENEDVLGLFEGALEAFEKEFKTNQSLLWMFPGQFTRVNLLGEKKKSLPSYLPFYLALWQKAKDKVLSPNHYHSRKKGDLRPGRIKIYHRLPHHQQTRAHRVGRRLPNLTRPGSGNFSSSPPSSAKPSALN